MPTTLDFTHDPARAQLGRLGQRGRRRLPHPEPAVRPLPPRRVRTRTLRIGVAIGDEVLDLVGARRSSTPTGHRSSSARSRRAISTAFMAHGRAARIALRHALFAGLSARAFGHGLAVAGQGARRCSCRMDEVEMARAVPHRRLHRLLHRHPSRDDGGQAVPPRQPAAAELQVGADRLPRPQLVDRRQRATVRAAVGPGQAVTADAPVFVPSQAARLRTRTRLLRRPAERSRARCSTWRRPRPRCSARRC